MPAHARSWPSAILLAFAMVYGPALLPFAAGPLTECDHCVHTYLTILPVAPAFIVAWLTGGPGVWFYALGGAACVGLLAIAAALARRYAGRNLLAAALPFAVLIGIECHLLGILLRA